MPGPEIFRADLAPAAVLTQVGVDVGAAYVVPLTAGPVRQELRVAVIAAQQHFEHPRGLGLDEALGAFDAALGGIAELHRGAAHANVFAQQGREAIRRFTGPAVVGNMGSRSRLQYTALGDTVNTAARFCAHAPAFHVLIGQMTYDQCKDYIAVDLVPGVQLKGKSAETFSLYQVTAIRENTTSPWVPFPTEAAIQSHHAYTLQYTGQTLLATGESGPHDILVGREAEQAISERSGSPN